LVERPASQLLGHCERENTYVYVALWILTYTYFKKPAKPKQLCGRNSTIIYCDVAACGQTGGREVTK
jgi:hypothetical protein